MGGSGHAFIAHTKALSPAAQAKDGGYGQPPHPRTVRAGQRYWPRRGRGRQVLVVRRVEGERAVLQSADERDRTVVVALARLLAVRGDGQGRSFQFQGYVPRRYQTHACVWAIVGCEAVLCLPEWHSRRPVRFPARLLPPGGRTPGAWLRLTCDLSASSAARLQLAELCTVPELDAGRFHAPALTAQGAGR